jgi:hypothetical protein
LAGRQIAGDDHPAQSFGSDLRAIAVLVLEHRNSGWLALANTGRNALLHGILFSRRAFSAERIGINARLHVICR